MDLDEEQMEEEIPSSSKDISQSMEVEKQPLSLGENIAAKGKMLEYSEDARRVKEVLTRTSNILEVEEKNKILGA